MRRRLDVTGRPAESGVAAVPKRKRKHKRTP